MISSDEQFLTEQRVAMNIRAMQEAITDLLDMMATTYGLPYVMRDSRDLEQVHRELATLLALLNSQRLKAVS